jgi:hypothetical protein
MIAQGLLKTNPPPAKPDNAEKAPGKRHRKANGGIRMVMQRPKGSTQLWMEQRIMKEAEKAHETMGTLL